MTEASITLPRMIEPTIADRISDVVERRLPGISISEQQYHEEESVEILAYGAIAVPSIGLLTQLLAELQQQTQLDLAITFESDKGSIVYPL